MRFESAEEKGDHSAIIFGTHYPNRLFLGCLPPKATAGHIGQFFEAFGKVVEAKVVLDEQGRSKRFGFVSFATPIEAERVLKQGSIYLLGKRINVGPAVKRETKGATSPTVPVRIVTATPADMTSSTFSAKPRYRYSFAKDEPTRKSAFNQQMTPSPLNTQYQTPPPVFYPPQQIIQPIHQYPLMEESMFYISI